MIDKSTDKRKKISFLVRSNVEGCILKSNQIICAMKIYGMDRFTLRNGGKTVAYGKILQDPVARTNTYV